MERIQRFRCWCGIADVERRCFGLGFWGIYVYSGRIVWNVCVVLLILIFYFNYSQPWCQPNRVHKLFSRTRVLRTFAYCVLAYFVYSRTRVLRTVTFTQTPVQARRKITFAAPAQNSSVRPYRFFRRTRAVLIYGRPASYRRIVCLVFAHGVQTWPRGARSHMTARSHFIISIQCTVFIQYSTLQGKTKKEGTDSLTLVNVFILYTHCHKYRIYFWDEVPTTKSQGWVPTKHTTVLYCK